MYLLFLPVFSMKQSNHHVQFLMFRTYQISFREIQSILLRRNLQMSHLVFKVWVNIRHVEITHAIITLILINTGNEKLVEREQKSRVTREQNTKETTTTSLSLMLLPLMWLLIISYWTGLHTLFCVLYPAQPWDAFETFNHITTFCRS